MAEFTEVWNEWKRMCEHKQLSASCCTCPLSNLECNAKFPKDQNHYDGHAIEEIIMSWAAEHREPVYPTWREWLETQYFQTRKKVEGGHEPLNAWMNSTHIPADIAEKLGIEPKEG